MAERKTRLGIVGCGNISGIYMQNAQQLFEAIEVVACADIIPERSAARAEEFGVPRVCTAEELVADPDVDIVVNLTTPATHVPVQMAAIDACKHVYTEKPQATTREDGARVVAAAREAGVRVGCAPDTFLGAGIQTCRKLIDEGRIGRPVAAIAFMMNHGHESWHPDPDFYYQPGGGPMFDMGPYYLTALVNLIGPVRRVTSSTQISFPERTIGSEPHRGEIIRVNTPTHIAGSIDFECGAVGTIITSFDVYAARVPRIQVFGSEGTLTVPDPNGFGGPVGLWRPDAEDWQDVPLTHTYDENSRGLGVADMAAAIRSGRAHRANGDLAFHVLDVMQAFLEASETGRHVEIESTCERPAPLPTGLRPGTLDD